MNGDALSGEGLMGLPLVGVRVLDASHIVAGPFCSLILADMGAEVIKIERPGAGELARGRGPFVSGVDGGRVSSRFLGVNRNKKSVSIDLRHPRCKRAFEEMVGASDVLVDNWGAGAFRRLGLGYERLREINPGLVYASITGYGDGTGRGGDGVGLAGHGDGSGRAGDDVGLAGHGDGSGRGGDGVGRAGYGDGAERDGDGARLGGPYSGWPANNMAIQAMAGWMELTGDPAGPPQAVGDNVGDSIPGLWAALSIVLALETRRQTGRGQFIDVAMYECLVAHIESNLNHYHATGVAPGRSHDRMATAGVTFRARDGYVVLAGARSAERLRALWQTIGRPDLAEDPRFLGGETGGDFFVREFVPAIEEWSVSRGKLEVAEALVSLGFSMGMAQTMEELAGCPHLTGRGMFVETGDTLGGRFRAARTPVRLTGCVEPSAGTPPVLGEHNREILCGIGGMSVGEVEALTAEGAL